MINENTLLITLKGGFDSNFTYIIGCQETGELALIDASVDWEQIDLALTKAKDHGFKDLGKVFLTHVHFDHISALDDIKEHTNAQVYVHTLGKEGLLDQKGIAADNLFEGEDILSIGNQKIKVIHTPGHQEECVCFLWEEQAMLFTGDTLFVEACGRCDLPGSNPEKQYASLKKLIEIIPDPTKIYAGHDYGSQPVSTMEREKLYNPYLIPIIEEGLSAEEKAEIWHKRRSQGRSI